MGLRMRAVVSQLGAISTSLGVLASGCGSSIEGHANPDAEADVGEGGAPADGHQDDASLDGVDRADSGPSTADAGLDSAMPDAAGRDGGSDAGSTPPSDAATDGGGNLCSTLGWCEITNTKLESVCPRPSPGGVSGCSSVIAAWSGAAADIDTNQLYIWGGGHNDYTATRLRLDPRAEDEVQRAITGVAVPPAAISTQTV
jgi:hypothetical protein